MAIIDILHDIAPQFIDDVTNARFINYATPLVSSCKFGDSYELAVAYLSAHMLQLSTQIASSGGTFAGVINSISEGSRALGYSTISPNDAELMTTIYGIEFIRLKRMYITPIMVTGYLNGGNC
jgi:hypothetical protein